MSLWQLTPLSNYLTQDVVRRILQDYFGYDVNFVMNVTDIDDKVGFTEVRRPNPHRSSCALASRTS